LGGGRGTKTQINTTLIKTMKTHKTDKNMPAGAEHDTVSHQTVLSNASIVARKSKNMD
jgi:hypothetical protein